MEDKGKREFDLYLYVDRYNWKKSERMNRLVINLNEREIEYVRLE